MIIYNGEAEKKLYKEVFAQTIEELANDDKDVMYLDADLMNSIGTIKFWKSNKKQAINCGIAEGNMIGVAAGLSLVGKKVYAHTFGPFASRRVYDQAFLSVAYSKNNLRLIGSDPGVTAAYNGGTHMPFEDIAMMRAMPEATVIEISNGVMLKSVLKSTKERPGLTYIRTTRKNYDAIYSDDTEFEIGKGIVANEGTDVTIIACGLMVSEAMKAAKILKENGVSARVIDMFTIKPLDAEIIIKAAKETGAIVTAENHNVIGGLSDAVGKVLLDNRLNIPFAQVAVNDEFGEVGPQDYLMERFGLTADNIARKVNEVLKEKA